MANTASELRAQWSNPSDVLSLLLLIGGDIVQKAIAQLVGAQLQPFGKHRIGFGITPVAFSFGWVAYGFTNLLSSVGEQKLMPKPDCASIVVNCTNGMSRVNESWLLGRILRDHMATHEVDPVPPPGGLSQLPSVSARHRGESVRIDIFELGIPSEPTRDLVWGLGWFTMVVQLAIALVPWISHRNWGIGLVTICGNALAITTCALPQWREEKWAARKLETDTVTCLTRGNGHLHIMVFIGREGAWHVESMATATSIPRPSTAPISIALAVLWTCLLISVAGLKEHTWYLVAIGGIGMLQNVYAAGKVRGPSTSNFYFSQFSRMPTIIGKRQVLEDDLDSDVDLEEAQRDVSGLQDHSMDTKEGLPAWLEPIKAEPNRIANVHGALMELEKWVPTAGLAMLQTFFPTSLQYQGGCVRDNIHKKFWKKAYYTKSTRRRAENLRRMKQRREELKRRKTAKYSCVEISQV